MQNHSSWCQHKQNLHYWCCHNVTVWYNCFVFICYLVVSFQLIMTLPCSAACLLCPDASREVQSTFTPKIIFCVPLSPSAPSREGEGLPVTLGGVIQMVHQMCGRSTWWEGGAGVKRATDCLGCLGAGWSVFMCASVGECTKSALRHKVWTFWVSLCIKYVYAYMYILCYLCSGLVASPSHPTILLLHSWLPHPAQLPLGLPPAHPLGRAGVLGAPPPVLPGSCCPQLRSCRRDWGRTKSLLLWLCLRPLGENEEVARRLLQSVLLQKRCLWLCSSKWVIKKDYRTELLHACSVMERQTVKWQHHLRGWLSCSIFW